MSDTTAWAVMGFGLVGLALFGALFVFGAEVVRQWRRRRRIRRYGCWEVRHR